MDPSEVFFPPTMNFDNPLKEVEAKQEEEKTPWEDLPLQTMSFDNPLAGEAKLITTANAGFHLGQDGNSDQLRQLQASIAEYFGAPLSNEGPFFPPEMDFKNPLHA